jgi:hypothetical protein
MVPKGRHIKFRRQRITQKKAYNMGRCDSWYCQVTSLYGPGNFRFLKAREIRVLASGGWLVCQILVKVCVIKAVNVTSLFFKLTPCVW